MDILFDNVQARDIAFKNFEAFSIYSVVETDEFMTLKEDAIPVKFCTAIFFVTFMGSMLIIWRSNLEVGIKVLMTFCGVAATAGLTAFLQFLEYRRRQMICFEVDKQNQGLVLNDRRVISKRDVVFFCAYLTVGKDGYPVVWLSVGHVRNHQHFEDAVVAFSGKWSEKERAGAERLATFFCVPLLVRDKRA
jgi:hypothetical protein